MSFFGLNPWEFFFGKSTSFPNSVKAESEDIPPSAKVLGEVWLGRPATGKTVALARSMVDHLIAHPEESMVSFDGSGAFTDTFLKIVLSQPQHIKDALLKRIIYDELGHPKYTLTLPSFHKDYGVPKQKQVARIVQNLVALNPDLATKTPVVGGVSIEQYGAEIFSLLSVISNEFGSTWQLTEAKYLLTKESLLKRALDVYGRFAPNAKWFFEEKFYRLKAEDRDLRTLGLISVLNDIEVPELRVRVGHHRPSYTMPEITEGGKILLVNASNVNNQERTLAYSLIDIKTHLMIEIARRRPNDPNNKLLTFLVDELPSLLEYADMQKTIRETVSYFRSRKLAPVIVAQNLAQFPKDLRPHIWSYANVICFQLLNFDDAYETAQQLFPYYSETIKASSPEGYAIYEADRGHYLQIANRIRTLKHRECVVRKQVSETKSDQYIHWVQETKEAKMTATDFEVQRFKDWYLETHGVLIDEADVLINKRVQGKPKKDEPPIVS